MAEVKLNEKGENTSIQDTDIMPILHSNGNVLWSLWTTIYDAIFSKITGFTGKTGISGTDQFVLQENGGAIKKALFSTISSEILDDLEVVWTQFTPDWGNITEGSGSNIGYYTQIKNTIIGAASFTLAANSSVGSNVTFPIPVNAKARHTGEPIGQVVFIDSGTATYLGVLYLSTATTAWPLTQKITSTYLMSGGLATATVPFTWTTGDSITVTFKYEVA